MLKYYQSFYGFLEKLILLFEIQPLDFFLLLVTKERKEESHHSCNDEFQSRSESFQH